jgi:hypothetical protein
MIKSHMVRHERCLKLRFLPVRTWYRYRYFGWQLVAAHSTLSSFLEFCISHDVRLLHSVIQNLQYTRLLWLRRPHQFGCHYHDCSKAVAPPIAAIERRSAAAAGMVMSRRRVIIKAVTALAAFAGALATGTPSPRSSNHHVGCVGRGVPSTHPYVTQKGRGGAQGGGKEEDLHHHSHGQIHHRRGGRTPTPADGGISRFLRSVIGRGEARSPAHDENDVDGAKEDETATAATTIAAKQSQVSGLKKQISLPDLNVENFLRIDFSGDLDCHILGHSHHHPLFESASSFAKGFSGPRRDSARSSTAALIRSRHPWTPNWIVGLHYDFAKCWYGATRAWSNVQFVLFPPPVVSSPTPIFHPRMILPAAFDWTTDRSLRDGNDRMNEATLQWKRSIVDRASTCLRGRVESATSDGAGAGVTGAKATLTLQVPLHRRLSYECRVVSDSIPTFLQNWSWLSPSSSTTSHSQSAYSGSSNGRHSRGFRLPDVTRLDDDGWWLPDVTLQASGHIESRNAAVLPHPTRLYDGRIAVRFTIRRSLLWSRADDDIDYGDVGDGDSVLLPSASPMTTIGLEIHEIQSHAMNGVKLQTELERPLHSLRMAFVQQLYRHPSASAS